MIKLVYCVTRHAALGRELFLHTWLHEHGPLVRSLAEALESIESLQAALISPRGAAAAATLLADEKRFIDLERSRTFIAEEHEVFG